jgi:hypothetical protein
MFTAKNAYIKNKSSQTNDAPEGPREQEANHKSSRSKEIIKTGAEINDMNSKRTMQRTRETKRRVFAKMNRPTLCQTDQRKG